MMRWFRRWQQRDARRSAANIATMVAEGIGTILEDLADDAQHDAWRSLSAGVIAATYRSAADRARLVGVELAETITEGTNR